MSKHNRNSLWLLAGALMLAGVPAAHVMAAEVVTKASKAREQAESRAQEQAASQPAPQRAAPAPQRTKPSTQSSNPGARPERAPSQMARGEDRNGRGNNRGNDGRDVRGNDRGGDRGVIGGALERNFGTRDDRNDRGEWRGDRGNDRDRGYRDHRRPRYVTSLPRGYRNYSWNGRPYYFYGGSWYRPYGSTFISIGAPYGLFVGTLPGYYSSFWYGGTRYFYADDTYYLYEPARHGYVVARSPYGNDDEEVREEADEDLFIYPARGQSEKQQSDDRYECHRWAADETRYDPIDDEYDAGQRADYVRAMTACLTGRGYSVK